MTFYDVISGQKALLGRILRKFRLHMSTLFGTSKGIPSGSRDLRSQVAMIQLYYILYYYSSKEKTAEKMTSQKKKTRETVAQLPVAHA